MMHNDPQPVSGNFAGNLAGNLAGNFVFLRADGLRLVLPQDQVGAAEYLDARPLAGDVPGLLRLPGEDDARVFAALSSRMTLLPECPDGRFVVTTLAGNEELAWCWSELQVLIGIQLQPLALPVALLAPGIPVDGYVEHAGEPAFLCDAGRLQEFALARGS